MYHLKTAVLVFLWFGVSRADNEQSFVREFISGDPRSPFELTWVKEITLFSGIEALRWAGLQVPGNIDPSPENGNVYDGISRNDVNAFDRMFIRSYSHSIHQLSGITNGILWSLPFSYLVCNRTRGDMFKLGVMFLQLQRVYPIATLFINPVVARKRPWAYTSSDSLSLTRYQWGQISFLSGHVNFGAAFGMMYAFTFSKYFPDSKWRTAVWLLAGGLTAGTGAFRVMAGEHFPTDAAAGMATGALLGWFIPWIHLKRGPGPKLRTGVRPDGMQSVELVFSLPGI